MEIVNREDIENETYRMILNTESHHDHLIIEDEHGVLRWRKNDKVNDFVYKNDLNQIVRTLYHLGYDKNSEIYRKLYRDMGYSLYGYWEVFYWEVNNPKVNEYHPNEKKQK